MTNLVRHRSDNSSRGPSAGLWADCPWDSIKAGAGAWVDEDFDKLGLITAPTTIAALMGLGWSGFSSTGSQITHDDASGIKLAETTDDEGTSIFLEAHPFQLSLSHGSFWFESRFKTLLTATTENRFFIGLMDTTAVTAAVPLTATGALADVNLVGFHYPDADTTTFDFSYKADGVAAVVVNDGLASITADTYVKAGFKFDARKRVISSYINGVKQANTKVMPSAAGTDFPNHVALGVVAAMSCGAAANDNVVTIDWIRAGQLDT